jgi:Right handed beta helix region
MTKIASLQAIAAALFACGLSAAPAQAGPNRTWVSGLGTDSGACTRAAPCKTFAFALTQTAAGGEIDVLDPAGYGAVTITKAVSIVNDGVGAAAIGAGAGNGITINAGAEDSVHVRGLTIAGLGSGANGILFNTGGNLAIENCVIRNFVQGINISPSTSSSFAVSNTIASNNGSGITVIPTGSAAVTGVLSTVTANNNGNIGIAVSGVGTSAASLNVTIVDSEISNNTLFGVFARSSAPGGTATAVMVRNSVASYSDTGLEVDFSAILRVAHSVVTGNFTGVHPNGGTIFSYGDNDIDGNTNNNTGALTPLAMH